MKEYVLDANAVIRYFGVGDGKGGDKVRALFEMAERGKAGLSMSVINAGEVFYVLLKHLGDQRAIEYVQALRHGVGFVDATAAIALEAARLKHHHRLDYADSFAAALALSKKATLVSADPSFERVGRSLKWMRLPAFESRHR